MKREKGRKAKQRKHRKSVSGDRKRIPG